MRRLLSALLVGCVLAAGWPAASASVASGTGRTEAPVNAALDAEPVLELLVTLRLLADLLGRGVIQPGDEARARLADALRPLQSLTTLPPGEIRRLTEAVTLNLRPSEVQALREARGDLERQVQGLLARARFATPDGPLNLNLARYGFMVPGGAATVAEVVRQPGANPYAAAGSQVAVLERLLALLER